MRITYSGTFRLSGFLILLGAALGISLLSPGYTAYVQQAMALALAILGVNVLYRAELLSFGHGIFYAAGAYAVAYLSTAHLGLGFLPLLALGSAAGAVLAAIAGLFMARYRGIFFAMLNLAVAMIAYGLLLTLYDLTGGSDGLPVNQPAIVGYILSYRQFVFVSTYVMLAVTIVAVWVTHRYLVTAPGLALRGLRDNEIRLRYLGISVPATAWVAYVTSGWLCGLGGAILAFATGQVTPQLTYWTTGGMLAFLAVLATTDSIVGCIAVAAIYELLIAIIGPWLGGAWELVLAAVALIAVRMAHVAPGSLAAYPRTIIARLFR